MFQTETEVLPRSNQKRERETARNRQRERERRFRRKIIKDGWTRIPSSRRKLEEKKRITRSLSIKTREGERIERERE